LPKKEAGAGLAFGAGATDALFGSGSGNALTKLTKYTAGFFLVLSLVVGLMHSRLAHASSSDLRAKLAAQKPATSTATTPAAAAPAAVTNQFKPLTATSTNLNIPIPAAAPQTNAPATTNATVPAAQK